MDYKCVVTLNVLWLVVRISFADACNDSTDRESLDKTVDCSSDCMSVSEPSNYAVIPYNTGGILSQFYKAKKVYEVPTVQRSIVIKQDWTHNGVAGVVWEAVSKTDHLLAAAVAFLVLRPN